MIRFNGSQKFNTPIGVAGYSDDMRNRINNFKVKAPNTKAVDSDGNLKRLFHGEKDSPSYHDLRYLKSGPDRKGLGVYYSSSNKDIAETYAQFKGNGSGKVREVYYNVENPRVIEEKLKSFLSPKDRPASGEEGNGGGEA